MTLAQRFIEFRVPPAIALARSDQIFSRTGRPRPLNYTEITTSVITEM